MNLNYDPESDAMSVQFTDADILESEEIAPGVILDFDKDGRIVAIELLDASRRLAPGALPVAAE